jgi:hypothetical protein
MLQPPNGRAVECLAHAEAMERRAREINDSETRANLFDTALRWRRLADSYEYAERVDDFLAKIGRSIRRK